MSRADTVHGWVEDNWHLDMTLRDWWERLEDVGFAFPTWPKGLGGLGADNTEARAMTKALASHGVIGPPTGNGPNMGGPTLIHHGTPEQQQRFVTPLADGREAWCQLFSEPDAGSDLASLACRAERDGDEFVINGQKVWNSSADVSDWGMLLARTDPDAPKHRGISFIMIEMDQPGIEARPLRQMNGLADFCEVFLTDARAKVGNVIGGLNDGWNVARTTLSYERAAAASGKTRGLASVRAGRMGGNLDRPVGELLEEARRASENPKTRFEVALNSRTMIDLAKELRVNDDPLVRQRLVRYHIHGEVYRLTGQRGRDNARSGRPGNDGSLMKLHLAMLAHESRDLSLAMLGAEGTLVDDDTRAHGRYQRAALSAFAPSFGGGTNEMQRNIVGERTLGLPREPATDADMPFRELRRSAS
jgi:alkylation response protein AidB-like acyl-CoA dehydrogenase